MAESISQPLSRASAPRRWPRRAAVGALAVSVLLLLATYMTVVVARLVGYDVVVTRSSVDATIPAGSVVVGRWLPPAEVGPGASVIFEGRDGAAGGAPKLHRVVELAHADGRVLARTRESSGGRDGRYVLSEAVIAPAFSLRFVGYLLSLLLTPLGWLVAFALPTGALFFLGLRRIWAPEERVAASTATARVASPDR